MHTKETCDCTDQPLDPEGYAKRVCKLEQQGLTRSDAQGAADAEYMNK